MPTDRRKPMTLADSLRDAALNPQNWDVPGLLVDAAEAVEMTAFNYLTHPGGTAGPSTCPKHKVPLIHTITDLCLCAVCLLNVVKNNGLTYVPYQTTESA